MLPSCNQVYILQYVKWSIRFQRFSSFVFHGRFSGFSFTSLAMALITALITSLSDVMIVSHCQISFLLLV